MKKKMFEEQERAAVREVRISSRSILSRRSSRSIT